MENIYCNRCEKFSMVFELLDNWNIDEVSYTVRGYESTDIEECSNCERPITSESYIIIDEVEFIETVGFIIAEVLSKEIGECQYCNDFIIHYTQKHGDPLELDMVFELVEGCNLPEDIKKIVYQNIYCSNCNNQLDRDQPYVTPAEVESWYEDNVEVVVSTLNITVSEGEDFINYLLKNPMLGLNHPVGQKIFKIISDKEISGITTLKSDEKLFRGRKRNKLERIATYIPEELWNPPAGIPGQGRYNPPGVSSLYLANNTDVILAELNVNPYEESIDIAEFLILEDMLMWDVRELDIDIFSSIPSLNKKFILSGEYIFPNFIAQCLMVNGYNGIIYNSTRGEGSNYCLFNFERNRDLVITKVIPFSEISNSTPVDNVLPF